MVDVSIRPIQLRDLPAIRKLDEWTSCFSEPLTVSGFVSHNLAAVVPVVRRRTPAYVGLIGHDVAGSVEVAVDLENYRWVVTRMSLTPHLDAGQQESLVYHLIDHVVQSAGTAGIKRVHIDVPEDSDLVPLLNHAGFVGYAGQTILEQKNGLSAMEPILAREQEPSDLWSVHQLYHLVTPRPVQYAEALTSNYWEYHRGLRTPVRAFVHEHDHEIAAYCRVLIDRSNRILSMLARPHGLEYLDETLQTAIHCTRSRSSRYFALLPDYHAEYSSVLAGLEFRPVGRRLRMVKYTVRSGQVFSRALHGRAVPEGAEKVAVGSPTFSVRPDQTDARSLEECY